METNSIRFAHLADCHLGSWRQPELQSLNFQSFQLAIKKTIEEKLDFVLISGDLFDSAYPPIDILKESFAEFKKLHDAKIPVYIIAGSHDFSASGKTFLDVLEKAGFCKNVHKSQVQEDGRIKLTPTFHENIAIYGYPGKKSGMEVEDLKKIYLDRINPFTILMLHTTLEDVKANPSIDAIEKEKLPLANYYAMGHVHKKFEDRIANSSYVYPGPTFPNNFQELTDIQHGNFQIVETDGANISTQNIPLSIKEVEAINIEITNALVATQQIISNLDKHMLRDKIVLLKLSGTLSHGKTGDIAFSEIDDFIKKKEAFIHLRNISSIKMSGPKQEEAYPTDNIFEMEKRIAKKCHENNPSDFNEYHYQLMDSLSLEKNEEEDISAYKERLLSELKNILKIHEVL